MNDIVNAAIPTREQIERLQLEMSAMPQAELVTEHYFVPGMYCRRLFRKAGTVIGGGANKVPVYSDGANWIIG